ncbi:PTS mannitol-specific transporter subunit IIBC [Shouchella clausii]|uniref:PTS mannitol-specific transporter subunit IIBC n=1 Tax=Shouchella clausii TaxID=79880 RepID=UPI000BA5E83C|nr:PTS mannitol-specific transporter subunit IIBC [Shouchella clausii]MEB5482017.1 PTS mannitol-specific transporter subunit IIBC [Shouchella clausii]PAD13527.1 PTS mannitol transporter subunit IICBA [Shouchella clausii]PAD91701.1 PTS mannitol transporter subunit IICBA [Shouchella clausii]
MAEKGSIRSRVQKFGSNLSSMIMPNIGAFIAWGLLTAIAVPSGIELFQSFVDPMITYLLPLLIAFAGGRLVHDFRGGVVGATAAMGVIVAADMPMFIGAMIMGPLGGYVIKKFDQVMEGKIKQGFEMLVNNFSAGILGAALALFGSLAIGPLVAAFTQVLETGVDAMISWGVLPLVSIFIEPAKILFLNNAINHGVIGPIAAGQVAEYGKSILYLLEANPGPGMGILLAYMIFGKGASRASSYGAGIIHFFGGIHEIYFPYVLMKPLLIVAAILGGAGGIFTLSLFNAGLVSVPSPGSIISILLLTASDSYVGVILSVLVATAISFVVASMILKFDRKGEEENLEEAQGKIKEMKGKTTAAAEPEKTAEVDYGKVSSIIFACDAGMGSSAMGASIMKDRVKKAGLEGISVANTAISNIPDSADLIITHKDLTERAKQKQPNALHVSVDNFMNSPRYQEIIEKLQEAHTQEEQQPTDKPIEKIVFACDAGMGSSAMGASLLKDKFKKAGITGIHVSNTAVSNIPADADLVITHKDLTERAKQKQPDAEHLSVENFLSSPRYDELVERLK